MFLFFLGTSGGMPTKERSLPAVLLNYNGSNILFDCGEGTQRQLMKYGISYGSISAVLLSHPHLDHMLGIFGLLETYALNKRVKPLKLFSHPMRLKRYGFLEQKELKEGVLYETERYIIKAFKVNHERAFGFVFEEKPKLKFYEEKAKSLGIKGILFREIQQKRSLVVNGRRVSLEEISYYKKGRKVVYTGDCLSDERVVEAAKDADVLIHDSTFSKSLEKEAIKRKHSTAEMAARTAKKANVKLLILTHFSPRYKDVSVLEKEAKDIFPNTIAAYDGLKIEL